MSQARVQAVVLGAGAAGIAAARALHDAGVDYLVVEARERIGGRIFTQHVPGVRTPIELGAEFIHGSAEPLDEVLSEANLASVDISGSRWTSARGRLRPFDDFWQRLDRVMRRLPSDARRDVSFDDFIVKKPGGPSLAADRRFALEYVEGFHAADPRLVSARALAENGSPGDDERERRLGRVLDGYDRVIEWMAAPLWERMRLSTVVTSVRWSRGRVTVGVRQPDGGAQRTIEARAVIVTVPLGVLKAPAGARGAIAFEPPLEEKRQVLERLAVGSVVRIELRLKERFWASGWFAKHARRDALDTLSFLHTNDPDFPVWWTAYPLRQPTIVGWCGGVRARELSVLTPDAIESRACAALARQLHLRPSRLQPLVTGSWTHDWEHDPFARGAYSYQMVGGADAPSQLAKPLRKTLFFAGEAADAEGSTGTVHGAIGTGRRAAAAVVRILGRSVRGEAAHLS